MSDLIKLVKAEQTNVRKPFIGPLDTLLKVDSEFSPLGGRVATQYKIGVTLECHVMIQEGPHMSQYAEKALVDTRRSIAQAVFGEFREDLNKIKHLAYNFDSDGVIDAIRTLENKMFEV
jgi:hypothetical protein